jgi:hypothetical protein
VGAGAYPDFSGLLAALKTLSAARFSERGISISERVNPPDF